MARIRRKKRGLYWYGPGCSGPESPTNDVDACCTGHDLCLKRGIHPCICDERFIQCLFTKRDPRLKKEELPHLCIFLCGSEPLRFVRATDGKRMKPASYKRNRLILNYI